jgi:hypothetical protein
MSKNISLSNLQRAESTAKLRLLGDWDVLDFDGCNDDVMARTVDL